MSICSRQPGVVQTASEYGDTDLDGDIDIFDYQALTAGYGAASGAGWADGDNDFDGDVDIFDYMALTANYGWSAGGGVPESSTVPEPTTAVVILTGAMMTLVRKRRS